MKVALSAGFVLAVLLAVGPESTASDEKDLAGTVIGSRDHTILAVALKEAGLVETLWGKGPLTVFAPTDAAFEKLGDDRIREVVKDKALLKKILLAHLVRDRAVYTKDLRALDGKEQNGFTISAGKDAVKIGPAKITLPDVQCANGVFHAIDTVLIPSEK